MAIVKVWRVRKARHAIDTGRARRIGVVVVLVELEYLLVALRKPCLPRDRGVHARVRYLGRGQQAWFGVAAVGHTSTPVSERKSQNVSAASPRSRSIVTVRMAADCRRALGGQPSLAQMCSRLLPALPMPYNVPHQPKPGEGPDLPKRATPRPHHAPSSGAGAYNNMQSTLARGPTFLPPHMGGHHACLYTGHRNRVVALCVSSLSFLLQVAWPWHTHVLP